MIPRVSTQEATQRAFDSLKVSASQALKTTTSQGNAITELSNAVAAVPTSGRLLSAPARLTGSGVATLPAGTCVIKIRFCGQGGGGGGAVSTGGNAAGAGGSTGEVVEVVIGTPGVTLTMTSYSWAMGSTGGGGGTSAGSNGFNGQASTFTYNGVVYNAAGGAGGTGSTGAAVGNWNPVAPTPGTPAVGTSGVVRRTYGLGNEGKSFSGAWISGNGGSSEFGAGGLMVGGTTSGNNGRGAGSGGSGAASGGVGLFGGSGSVGEGIIEFYG